MAKKLFKLDESRGKLLKSDGEPKNEWEKIAISIWVLCPHDELIVVGYGSKLSTPKRDGLTFVSRTTFVGLLARRCWPIPYVISSQEQWNACFESHHAHKLTAPVKLLHSLKAFNNKGSILPPPLNFYIHWRSSIRVQFSHPHELHSFKSFNKGLILPPALNLYIHWRPSINKSLILPPQLNFYIHWRSSKRAGLILPPPLNLYISHRG